MSLCEWYAGRTVLVTGVTSELGRALLEKILRSLPNVKVYVMLRSQKGLTKEDRMKKIFTSHGYERLRQEEPDVTSRVKILEGNLLYTDLGLSSEDQALLRNVSVIIHADGPYNTLLEYCQDLPKLTCAAVVSTIFRHRGKISEKLQDEGMPNMPVALVRVPIIGPAYKEAKRGFVELLNGSTAFMVGAGFALGDSTLQAEIIPVDLAVNTLIAAAWEVSVSGATEPVVYNAATIGCTWKELIKNSRRAACNFPYPTFGIRGMTSIKPLYWILVILLEWLPSLLCDIVLSLCGRKQRFLAEYYRVRNALQSLEPISTRSWPTERRRVYLLDERLTEKERNVFPVIMEIDIEDYVVCAAAAARKYCANEVNLQIMKITRIILLFVPVILVVSYFIYYTCHMNRNK